MGYVPGKGLGKNATGIADPVSIEIPQGREGLGFASEKNERIMFRENLRQQIQMAYKDEFRSTMAVRFRQNRLNRQLDVARRICQDLDLKELIETPVHESFWPPVNPVPTEAVDNSKYGSSSSSSFKSLKDRSVHTVLSQEDCMNEDFPDNDLAKLDANHANCDHTSIQRNFIQLLDYLRSRHNYCFWCSLQYQSQSELLEQCPGEDEDLHD
ncbi:unnamed protein product [Schistosoma turkestanicum]|nr:unnamed protein product [Schistosoma turkestanicum]